jgi:hypothetical protein
MGDRERGGKMAVKETKAERIAERAAEQVKDDYKDMAKAWKDSYLDGLDACLQAQAENQRLIKDAVKQGLAGSRSFLTWWKDWIEDQTQKQAEIQSDIQKKAHNQRQANNVNPFLGFTKQSTEAVVATVEPLLKNSEAALESSFGYYENAVANPSRKYVRDINQQVLDAVVPG